MGLLEKMTSIFFFILSVLVVLFIRLNPGPNQFMNAGLLILVVVMYIILGTIRLKEMNN